MLKSLFKSCLTYFQCSSSKYLDRRATITGIASLYSHTNFLKIGVTLLYGMVLSAIIISLANLSQMAASYFSLIYLNLSWFHICE
jgi:hypothetical protein